MSVAIRAAGATDVGRVRESNQDGFLVIDGLWAVADGVGGHRGGEVASATALEVLEETFQIHTVTGLIEAVLRANRKVWEGSQTNPDLRGMGTTLTAVGLVRGEDGDDLLALANVGDSRGYMLQEGELTQLTEDHSLVEELVREGRLSREEADVHPQRSLITRALGLDPDVDVDYWELIPYAGYRFLLCTDGLTNELTDDRIASVLRRLADPTEAARELVAQAKSGGGRDNITVVVIDVVDDDHRAEKASAALADEHSGLESAAGDHEGDIGESPEADAAPTATAPPPRLTHTASTPTEGRRSLTSHLLTWRVLAFFLLLAVVAAAAVGAVGWYARRAFYVGIKDDTVSIFRGQPEGLLWFKPTLQQRTDLTLRDVPPSRVDEVRAGKREPSLAAAQQFVRNLRDEAITINRSTTSTTAPPHAAAPTSTRSPQT